MAHYLQNPTWSPHVPNRRYLEPLYLNGSLVLRKVFPGAGNDVLMRMAFCKERDNNVAINRHPHLHVVGAISFTPSPTAQHFMAQYYIDLPFHASYDLKEYLDSTRTPHICGVLSRSLGCLATALHHLHTSVGLVHCDIKPQNVLIHNGRPLIIDFGSSRLLNQDDIPESCPGDWAYLGPEGGSLEPSRDIWAFGILMLEVYNFLYGYSADDFRANVFPNRLLSPTGPTKWIATLKPWAVDAQAIHFLLLAERCVHPDPAQRPSSDYILRFFRRFLLSYIGGCCAQRS